MFSSALGMKAQLTLESSTKYYLRYGSNGDYLKNAGTWLELTEDESAAIRFSISYVMDSYVFATDNGTYLSMSDNGYAEFSDEKNYFDISGDNNNFSISGWNGNYLANMGDYVDFDSEEDFWFITPAAGGGGTSATRILCRLINASNKVFQAEPKVDYDGKLVTGGYNLGTTTTELASTNYNSLWYAETTDEGATYTLVHANSGAYLGKDRIGDYTLGDASNSVKTTGKNLQIDSDIFTITNIDPAVNPITYTLNGSGIGTLCLPFDFYASPVNSTDDLTANIITSGTSESLNLTAKDCSQTPMPKKTGYIMIGNPGATYTISPVDNQETADTDGNLLSGSLCCTKMTPNSFYGLKTTDGTEGKLGSAVLALATTSAIPANKAYLNASNISSGISQFILNFNDEESTTAIKQLVSHSYQQSAAYNLAGRRVSAFCKGISIANGKKVIK